MLGLVPWIEAIIYAVIGESLGTEVSISVGIEACIDVGIETPTQAWCWD